jgi:cardiolipin synthase
MEPKRKLAAQAKLHEMLLTHITTSPLRTNSSRLLRTQFGKDLLHRFTGARKRIWITTPYFIPPRPLLRALIQARKNGADVRLLLPAISDMKVVRWVSSLTYQEMLKAGLRIFEYQPAVLHAKTMLIDDWAMIGSSNLNHRSALHDIEVNLASTLASTVHELARQYEVDLAASHEITLGGPHPVSFVFRLLSRLFVFFRYWM